MARLEGDWTRFPVPRADLSRGVFSVPEVSEDMLNTMLSDWKMEHGRNAHDATYAPHGRLALRPPECL